MERKRSRIKSKKNTEKKKYKLFLSKILTKENIANFLIILFDIILVIYCAFKNKVNYVNIFNQKFFVGETKYLLFGRNYINLIIIGFFFGYFLLMNKFFLKKKITKKFMILSFICLVVINLVLFYIFSKRIY